MGSSNDLGIPGVSAEDLSGPKIDRRTTMKLLAASGMVGFAGCLGDDDDDTGDDTGDDSSADDDSDDAADFIGGTLHAGSQIGEWSDVEPMRIAASQIQRWMRNWAHGGLRTNGNLEVVPEMAVDWEVSDDPFSVTLEIQEGIQFHSGREVLAEDFVYAVERAREHPETNILGETGFLKDPIDGEGVEVLDDYRVRYNYTQPYAPALIDLTTRGRISTPVDENVVDDMGDEAHNLEPVSTGPFEVAEHVPGDFIRFEAFDDFYATDDDGNRIPYLDEIRIDFIPEAETAVSALLTGEIQFLDRVPQGQVPQLEGQDNLDLVIEPMLRYEGFVLNHAREHADTPEKRRVIAKLLDNEEFVERALSGNGTPITGPLAPTHGWVYRDEYAEEGAEPGGELKDPSQRYDPEGALEIIEEEGLEGMSFTIQTTSANERNARVIRSLIQDASEGKIEIDIEMITDAQLSDLLGDPHPFDATFLGGGGPDPDGMMYNFWRLPPESKHPELADEGLSGPEEEGYDGIWNHERFTNERAHELLAEQRTIPDQEERAEVIWELEDLLIRNVARVFLSVDDNVTGVGETVRDFSIRDENQDLQEVWLDE